MRTDKSDKPTCWKQVYVAPRKCFSVSQIAPSQYYVRDVHHVGFSHLRIRIGAHAQMWEAHMLKTSICGPQIVFSCVPDPSSLYYVCDVHQVGFSHLRMRIDAHAQMW